MPITKDPKINLKHLISTQTLTLNHDARVERAHLQDLEIEGKTLHHIIFDEVKLSRCVIKDCHFTRLECLDVIFEDCQFTNNTCEHASLIRTAFNTSKLDGTLFKESLLEHISIHDTRAQYLGFTHSTLKGVTFNQALMPEVSFFHTTFEHVTFDQCDLKAALVHDTRFKNIDVSTCEIDGMQIQLPDALGMNIHATQAAQLCALFGIKVKH